MLNTHNISFYDPYRDRNSNSALEIEKQHILKRIVLQQNHVTPHQSFFTWPVWAKFVRGVFFSMQALFSYIFTSQKTRSSKCQSWDGDDKKNHLCPGYVATVFFLFFRTLKKAYYRRKKTEHKKLDLSPLPTPKGGGVECRIDTSTPSPLKPVWKMARRLGLRI